MTYKNRNIVINTETYKKNLKVYSKILNYTLADFELMD